MNLDITQFISKNWNYYLTLENDFINITRYVKLDPKNYETFSDEITKLIQTIGAECDLMFKKNCGYKLTRSCSIIDDYTKMLDEYPQITKERIIVKYTDIILQPFKNWDKEKKRVPEWWTNYNKLKHNREGNDQKGNLKNLLNILAALFFLEMYFCRKIGRETNNIDIPNEKSKIFVIENWKVNPTEKNIFIKENIPETEKIDIELPYLVGGNELEIYYNGEHLIRTSEDRKCMGHYIECGETGKMSHFIMTTGDWSLMAGDSICVKIKR